MAEMAIPGQRGPGQRGGDSSGRPNKNTYRAAGGTTPPKGPKKPTVSGKGSPCLYWVAAPAVFAVGLMLLACAWGTA